MPTIRSEFLDLLRSQELALNAAWSQLADQIAVILARHADRDGTIPPSRYRQLRADIQALITRYVLAQPDNAAFRVLANGTIYPLSPFMQTLWSTLDQVMRLAVLEQNQIMTQHIADQIQGQLRRAFLDPFERLNQLPPPEASVLRLYEHPLEARRSDGLQMEQRLPMAVADFNRRLMSLINPMLGDHQSVQEIERDVRKYFDGSLRRLGMQGRRAGERLRRIAQSEPIFAFSQASRAAAATNPFIVEVFIRRTRSVPCAICDPIVAGNPYTAESFPIPGYHSHCVCKIEYEVSQNPQWDFSVDNRWTNTAGAMSNLFIERLLRMN